MQPDTSEAQERALVAALLDTLPDSVHFKDRAGRFIAVGRAKGRRHDVAPESLVGRMETDLLSREHADWSRRTEENVMATGTPVVGRLERVQLRDGRELWTEVTTLPLRDDTGAVIGTFGISRDVTPAQDIALELEKAHRDLVEASRAAGMAEVATGVLHNVGNVLTSLNVSASVIASSLHHSKAGSLGRLATLLQSHESNLAQFIDVDPKGRRVPEFIESLARHSLEESDRMLREIESLQQNVDHIKEIVSMQQAYATMVSVVEPLDAAALMDDALRMNAGALARHDVAVNRSFASVPAVLAEKAKVLQILVNLIGNAKHATDEGRAADKAITLRIQPGATPATVQLIVADNGIGIPAENLEKIFTHGFTTRKGGHGFGLHSAQLSATQMNGTLRVQSPGIGCGSTFTLELPAAPAAEE